MCRSFIRMIFGVLEREILHSVLFFTHFVPILCQNVRTINSTVLHSISKHMIVVQE